MTNPILTANGDVKGVWVKKAVGEKSKDFYANSSGYYQLYKGQDEKMTVWAFTWVLDKDHPIPDHLKLCDEDEVARLEEIVNRK